MWLYGCGVLPVPVAAVLLLRSPAFSSVPKTEDSEGAEGGGNLAVLKRSSMVVGCAGCGIIRRSVALSLLLALLVTVPSSLATIFLAAMRVLSWSEAGVEPDARIGLPALESGREWQ